MSIQRCTTDVVVIGGGFTGLAAAYELAQAGVRVVVLEKDGAVGGLAGSFEVKGQRLEKFYHHWFTSDEHVTQLVSELGTEDYIVHRPSRTGMYYANSYYRLSTPLDLLKFKPLSFSSRLRLGWLVLRARMVHNWRELEGYTAEEWLRETCGNEAYEVVWEPLLRGKFGPYASEVSAVWFWNKLKLRGGSRGKGGEEVLAYYRGGFAKLADQLVKEIECRGGSILTGEAAEELTVVNGCVTGVETSNGWVGADHVLSTTALPITAELVRPHVEAAYYDKLNHIDYLANVCLVLELDRSLSDTYWLNVNDPGFPFVGVIEHTNFEPSQTYGGRHIVYLSKYLPAADPLYTMADNEALDYCLSHLQRMFPDFECTWVQDYHVWRARYAQPVVTCHYSRRVPEHETPIKNFYLSTMAQVYPEDRGTNHAIREGRKIGRCLADEAEEGTPKQIPLESSLS